VTDYDPSFPAGDDAPTQRFRRPASAPMPGPLNLSASDQDPDGSRDETTEVLSIDDLMGGPPAPEAPPAPAAPVQAPPPPPAQAPPARLRADASAALSGATRRTEEWLRTGEGWLRTGDNALAVATTFIAVLFLVAVATF
jgi:hypothetical protein